QKDAPLKTYEVNGHTYRLFVPWLRDHVYVLQAMKYFSPHVRSGVELFLDQQTPQGFFYDYLYPLTNPVNNRLNFLTANTRKFFPKNPCKCIVCRWKPMWNIWLLKVYIISGKPQAIPHS
ncbi:MAG: hypothetical protein IRZ29_04175, partial [Thermoflavifilum sp.]|nr:hypothetical protein [Thermoflavifilum sp.]